MDKVDRHRGRLTPDRRKRRLLGAAFTVVAVCATTMTSLGPHVGRAFAEEPDDLVPLSTTSTTRAWTGEPDDAITEIGVQLGGLLLEHDDVFAGLA